MRSKKRIKPFMKLLTKLWEESPDLRFGQFLINLGIVADDMRTWSSELSDYRICHEEMRKIQTWGKKTNNGLGHKHVLIKDLETDHIKNILKTQEHIFGTDLENVLKEELKFRKKKK